MGRQRSGPENRGRIPAAVSIDGRPAVVDRRSRFGDWEGDTVVGAGRRGGAVTLVERKSGYLLLGGVEDLRSPTVRQAATDLYATMPRVLRKTLTLDNGKEFAEHAQLAAEAELKIYFAKPYSAWQRGTNENTNGLVRQFFPKGTDLAHIPEHRFHKVQHLLTTVRENVSAIELLVKFSTHDSRLRLKLDSGDSKPLPAVGFAS